MSKILKADFSNAREGDRVKHINGTIGSITKVINFPNYQRCGVYIKFIDGEEKFYNYDGFSILEIRTNKYNYPEVFYNFEGQFPTIEACMRPLPKIEVDEKIWVWDCIAKDFLPMHFYRFVEGGINVWEYGKTSFTTSNSSHCYKYWKLASDETINSGNLDEIEDENE